MRDVGVMFGGYLATPLFVLRYLVVIHRLADVLRHATTATTKRFQKNEKHLGVPEMFSLPL